MLLTVGVIGGAVWASALLVAWFGPLELAAQCHGLAVAGATVGMAMTVISVATAVALALV